MKWEIELLKDDNVILVKTRGTWKKELFQKILKEITEFAEANQTKSFIIDNFDLDSSFRIIDIFVIGEQLFHVADYKTKIAMINSKMMHPSDEKLDFFKTVVDNRGINLEYFDGFDKALEWIRS